MRDLSTTDYEWGDNAPVAFDTASLVDRHSSFDGNFRSHRDLRVEGELKGTVSCGGTLFVSEGATVNASIEAEHITVAGELTGEIRCRGRLQILPSGKVRAKVATGSLVIQEGAIYEGQLEMAGIERLTLRPIRARPSHCQRRESGADERQPGNGTTYIRRLGSPEAPWEATDSGAGAPESGEASTGEGSAG